MQKIECSTLGLAAGRHESGPTGRPHRHFEVELTLIEMGKLVYLLGGKYVTLRANQVAVFWAALPHRIVEVQEHTVLHWLTVPLGDVLRWRLPGTLTQLLMNGQVVIDDTRSCGHFDARAFRRWQEDLYSASPEIRDIILLESEACLRRLALSLVQQWNESEVEVERMVSASKYEWQRAEQAAHFITEHYTQPLSVGDIAHVLGLHEHSVMRLFQKTFGMSIVEYITQYRLAHAQRMLATTDASVLEVAIASGFGSSSRFYAVFTQALGHSPRAYRQALFATADEKDH